MKILKFKLLKDFARKHPDAFVGTHAEYDKIKDIKNI